MINDVTYMMFPVVSMYTKLFQVVFFLSTCFSQTLHFIAVEIAYFKEAYTLLLQTARQ